MALLVVTYDSSTGLYKTQKVGSAQIADGAVVSAKIGANVIATPHIANQGILSASIGAGIVGTPHLANQAITSAKIAANAIGGPHILDGSILGADLANQAVTSAKIAANAIGGPHILDGSILGADLANQAVTSAKIGALAVGTPHLAANAITSGKVASGGLPPLTNGKIWAGIAGDRPAEADPIPLTSDWKGDFNWDTSANTTDEIDISALFSTNLALTNRRKYSVKLDLTNVAADASFVSLYLAVKEKIDGTNYRAIDRKTITKADIAATAEPGIPIDIPATSENIQITMQMTVALAVDKTIYYAVVKEHLE